MCPTVPFWSEYSPGTACSLVTRRQEEQKTQCGERKRPNREEYGHQLVLNVSSLEDKIEVTNRTKEEARVEVEYTLQGNL